METLITTLLYILVFILAAFSTKLTIMYFALRAVRAWQQIVKATLLMYSVSLLAVVPLFYLWALIFPQGHDMKAAFMVSIFFIPLYVALSTIIETVVAYLWLRPIDESRLFAAVSAANVLFWLGWFLIIGGPNL